VEEADMTFFLRYNHTISIRGTEENNENL